MSLFSALNFVEAVEIWEFLEKPLTAYREGKTPDLLDMVHSLESKKEELTRLIENGASRFSNARRAWDVIDAHIVFPSLNIGMIERALIQACRVFPALIAVREIKENRADLDSALIIAALSSDHF